MKYPPIVVAAIAGVVVGAVAVGIWSALDSARTERMWHESSLATAVTTCSNAYFEEAQPVAIWELRSLVRMLEDYLACEYEDPQRIRFLLFLTHGRLAKLNRDAGWEETSEDHAAKALAYGDVIPQVTNSPSLFEAIQRLDASEFESREHSQRNRDTLFR